MPSKLLQTDAFILLKRPPADAYQAFTVFAPDFGNLPVLQRLPKKSSSGQTLLDLFDEAALQLESSNQGRTWFLREARLINRPAAIGRSYDALRFASALAALVARHPAPAEGRAQLAALLRTAFAAFATAGRPDIVYLKSLYCFARDEGHPVREQWFPTLPPSDRASLTTLLNRPLAEQTAAPDEVARLLRRLETYLRSHTEILLDD